LYLQKDKKIKLRKLCWILAAICTAVLILILLIFHKPSYYMPKRIADGNRISPYFSHILLPQLYNGLQRGEAFEVELTEEGVNDMVGRLGWPKVEGSLSFSVPVVFFRADKIVIADPVKFKGVELMVTTLIEPKIDQQGSLNLPIKKIKLGAVRFTILGKAIARRALTRQTSGIKPGKYDFELLVVRALFDNECFEPLFDLDAGRKIRVQRITVEQGKLTIGLAALSE
jgi:hypothetical protein